MNESWVRTFSLLDVVSRSRLRVVARDAWDLEHQHDAVEKAVHDLEPGRLVAPDCGGVADVARLALERRVFEHDV